MPVTTELTLTESYHDLPFLEKLINQGSESRVMPAHQATAKSLHKRLRGKGKSEVKYRQRRYKIDNATTAPIGRLWPAQSRFVCYQNMLGSMRRVLAAGRYIEVDMENAQFQLLAGKFPDATAIQEYCAGRKQLLETVAASANCAEWVAKQLFIILIFGGSVATWRAEHNIPDDAELPPIVDRLKKDVDVCKALFGDDDANIRFVRASKTKNSAIGKPWENTAFALWLQDLEAKCMLEAIAFLQSKGVSVASLIHDGALISESDRERVDLSELSKFVRGSTGLKCSFAVKDLDPDAEDLDWKKAVEDGFADPAAAAKAARDRRDPMTNLIVDAAMEGGHRLLARVFEQMFPGRFAYLGKLDGWFSFQSPRWVRINGDTEDLMRLMDDDLHARIAEAVDDLSMEEPRIEEVINATTGLLSDIARLPFKNDLVKQLRISYKVSHPGRWLSLLDNDDYLLGFEDCVYDFRERCFRDGRPEDMVSLSTGHTREEMEVHMSGSDIGGEIIDAIASMHESEDVLWYVLKNLATSVVGARPNDRFQIWSGTGANGKGLTKNLVGSAFGEYYYEPGAGLFASRSVSGSVLSSELAKLKGKRICIASEAEPGDKLRAGLLKQCTGHDLIQARDLYQSAMEFRCVANIVLCFNEIPGVDDSSGGIERRLDLVRYPFKFVDEPKTVRDKPADRTVMDKFCSKEYGASFLSSLIKIHLEFGFEFDIPASVKQEARDYLGENDVLGEFLSKYYEQTGEYRDFVKLSDVWETLRSDRTMFDQLEMRHSRSLSQKLKMKGLTVALTNGANVLRCYKLRDPVEMETDDGCEA